MLNSLDMRASQGELMDATFEYVFPSIRGVQAGREFYVSMCPLHLIPKIFLFNEEELVPELRAQRVLNKARIPELARYILDNPKSYIFSALTASIDGEVKFEAMGSKGTGDRIGSLRIPMSSRFLINDGQHRRAAVEVALRENPDLAHETIAVVFFLDVGLDRCQQMFADLNRYSVRATRSIGILYDHRDEKGTVAKRILEHATNFRQVIEYERSTLSLRSRKLFTLSAFYTALNALVVGIDKPKDEVVEFASEFWDTVWKQFPEWEQVRQRKLPAGEVRGEFIHSHGVALHALARVGNALLRSDKKGWKQLLSRLSTLDWSRKNTRLWEGRAMIGGRVSKAGNSVLLTTAAIKKHIGLPLTAEEQRAETAINAKDKGGKNANQASAT
jgi:DNA sulfur modification protein DndB